MNAAATTTKKVTECYNKSMSIKETRQKRFKLVSYRSAIFLAILLIVFLGFVIFVSNRASNRVPAKPTNTTGISNTYSQATTTKPVAPTSSPATTKASSASQSKSSGDLVAPYGGLVSNHKPGQNGSNFAELSQCITSPGAKCYIRFTQGGRVINLPEKTADSNGAVFWEWNVKDIGLTSGKWSASAVATLNGQTKTTTDQLALEVP